MHSYLSHHWRKFGENPTNTSQDIVLTSPESAVSSILYSTMTLTYDPKLWRVHLCPIMHHWGKFGENVKETLQNIVLTFWDAHTDEQDNNSIPPATLRWAEA